MKRLLATLGIAAKTRGRIPPEPGLDALVARLHAAAKGAAALPAKRPLQFR